MYAEIFAAAMCNCVLLKMLMFVKNSRICAKSPKNCKNRPALPVKFAKSGVFLRVCGDFLVFFGVFALSCPKIGIFFIKSLCEKAVCDKIIKRVGKFRMVFLFVIVN